MAIDDGDELGFSVITAAAQALKSVLGGKKKSTADSRQSVAWDYWDSGVPEVGFAATWIGNQMGRARLYAGRREPDGSVTPLPIDHRASDLVAGIGGGPSGQAEMLAEFGPHLVVAGEAWIIVEYAHGETWHVVSTEEVSIKSGTLQVEVSGRELTIPVGGDDITDPEDTTPLAVRVWQPHPKRHNRADSPIMRSFALLDELRLLNSAVAAIAKSRLTGRGIMFVPEGIKTATGQGNESDLAQAITEVASLAYSSPDTAAATVPIIVTVPRDGMDAVQHLTFESAFDSLAVTLREETIRRFAASLDTPAEVLLGTAGANHWSAWAIEESAIRVAIEPRLGIIANALTEQWLRPILESEGHPDAEDVLVWYDSSPLRVRTNRAQTAMEMYDRAEITGEALRRETAFEDGDAPDPDDKQRAMIERLVLGAPSLAPLLLPVLGINIPGLDAVAGEDVPGGDDGPPEVEIPTDEDTSPPRGENIDVESDGLFAACDGLVYRALERAGQRLRSRSPRSERGELQELEASLIHTEIDVCPSDVDDVRLLEGAWVRVPTIAERYDVNADELAQVLDDHVRNLLVSGVEYLPEELHVALGGVR